MADSPDVTLDPDELYFTDTEKTFQHEARLPALPVADLDDALAMYLDSVVPHVTPDEYKHTAALVDDFKRGVGRELYKRVVNKATREKNWLSEWWDNAAYLSARTPCAPFINTNGPDRSCRQQWPPLEGSQSKRMAFILHYIAIYWDNVRRERLKVDRNKSGDRFCMNQYTRFLNSCRIPGTHLDHMRFYFQTESEGVAPAHVVVIRRGHFFSMGLTGAGGEILTPPELEHQLAAIVEKADTLEPAPGVGALTADDRISWAQMRKKLIELHPQNQVTLEEIQKSILVVAMDEVSSQSESEMCYLGMGGEPRNRWFDKPITVIVTENGLFTSNSDHTACEGIVLVSMMHYCDMCLSRQKGQWKGSQSIRDLPPPQEFPFHVDDEILARIAISRENFIQATSTVEIVTRDFTDYGRVYLRSVDVHVDTHIQMALQYTYYRLYKKAAPTYETATTRKFWHGRTETVRSCTREALDFSKAMCHPTLQSSDKYRLYKVACDKHIWLLNQCQLGRGCDRLMLGLYLQSLEDNIPLHAFFTDPSQIKSGSGGNYVLSTSFVGYTNRFGGCPPMVEHGYGVFYKVNDTSITMYATSMKTCAETDAALFVAEVCRSLQQMKDLLEANKIGDLTARL